MGIFSAARRGTAPALLCALTVFAPPAIADDRRIDDAWKAALVDQQGVLSGKQLAIVNAIAYGAAAALLCDGIGIDPDKVAAATTGVLAEGPKDLTEEEELVRYTNIMLMMGTSKGILLSEGALHKADFCANALEAKTSAPAETFWK